MVGSGTDFSQISEVSDNSTGDLALLGFVGVNAFGLQLIGALVVSAISLIEIIASFDLTSLGLSLKSNH